MVPAWVMLVKRQQDSHSRWPPSRNTLMYCEIVIGHSTKSKLTPAKLHLASHHAQQIIADFLLAVADFGVDRGLAVVHPKVKETVVIILP